MAQCSQFQVGNRSFFRLPPTPPCRLARDSSWHFPRNLIAFPRAGKWERDSGLEAGMSIFDRNTALVIPLGLCLLAGCVTPWNTQMPTPYAGPPAWETRRNERYDPFARSDLGPDTMSRPREYMDPRSSPRQSKDAAIQQGPNVSGVPNPATAPGASQPTQRYSGVVPH